MNANETTKREQETLAYQSLDPDQILSAIETQGYITDGRLLALNSYENRVYRVGLEEAPAIVVKFYRPFRWTDQAILEEHQFAQELADAEIPVIPPLQNAQGETLHTVGFFRFAVFENHGGRPPELDNEDHLNQLGRFLGRIHNVGASRTFNNRPDHSIQDFAGDAWMYVLEHGFIPRDLELAYRSLCEDLMRRIKWCFERCSETTMIRLHGDCHPGNILWTPDGPHIVDLDDARTGPAMQDLWMFLSGDRVERTWALSELLDGYKEFRDFPANELHLIEALRTMRMIYYHGWLAKRWKDPAFPHSFPWFNTQRNWEQHILDLREQASMMDEEPLHLFG